MVCLLTTTSQVTESSKRNCRACRYARQILLHYSSAPSAVLLPVSFRKNFKILLLTFKAIHRLAMSYIGDLVRIKPLKF